MINKKLLKKNIPSVIISLFIISLCLSVACMLYNKLRIKNNNVVEGMSAAGRIITSSEQQALEDLELYPILKADIVDIPIAELPPQSTNMEISESDHSTDSKIYYNANIACGTNVASVSGITGDMSDDQKIKLCDDACKNNPECKSWYVSSDNKCWLKPCTDEKDIHKYNTISSCPEEMCTGEQEGDTCTSSVGWCCKGGVWNKGVCKKPIVGMLQVAGSYTAATGEEGGTKERCDTIIDGKFFGPGGLDMSEKEIIAPGCSASAWCCRPIGEVLRYQADTPGWKNAWGSECKNYSEAYCKDGRFRPGFEWTGGEKYNYPENNCVACGKGR